MNISGRQFYKCGKPQGQGCNYFMWADDMENNVPLPSPRFESGGSSNSTATTSNTFPHPSWGMQGKCIKALVNYLPGIFTTKHIESLSVLCVN
jgi:hypothetical protein